jgi:hypothetical protein
LVSPVLDWVTLLTALAHSIRGTSLIFVVGLSKLMTSKKFNLWQCNITALGCARHSVSY